MNDSKIEAFWQRFLRSLPAGSEPPPLASAWPFGDNPDLANELGALVLAGIKTATCASLEEMALDGESLPRVGDLSVILDGAGNPLCVIETVEIAVTPYDAVDARFAFDEGEGNRSLAYWQEAHRRFFSRTLTPKGLSFRPTMPLVCERFRLVFPPPNRTG